MLGILTQALLPKFSIAPIVDGFFLFEFLRPNWFHFFATYYAIRSESFVRIFSHLLYHFVVLCSVWFFFLFFFIYMFTLPWGLSRTATPSWQRLQCDELLIWYLICACHIKFMLHSSVSCTLLFSLTSRLGVNKQFNNNSFQFCTIFCYFQLVFFFLFFLVLSCVTVSLNCFIFTAF